MQPGPSRTDVEANVEAIRSTIEQACVRVGRSPGEVTVVAAAKTVPAKAVSWAVEAGCVAVGHNYVNELRAMHGLIPKATWHFIGTLQSNTARHVATLADVVETVAGGRATERLARRAATEGRRLDVLLEVDLAGRGTGVAPEHIGRVADHVAGLNGLRLRGLMTIPDIPDRPEDARPGFAQLRELRDEVVQTHPEMLALSMGMSFDYAVAVEEGASIVRIGTALFGPRTA